MKNKTTLFLLAFLLGPFGIHRFYAGKKISGILMLLTFGGFGLWLLIDIILIITGEFKDSEGNKINSGSFGFRAIMKPISLFLIACSCFCLIVSFLTYQSTRSFIDNAVATEGSIIELRASVSGGNTYYYPTFEFHDLSGKKHTIYSKAGSNPTDYIVGEKVGVLYAEGSPENAKLNSFFSLWFFPLVFSVVGGGNLLLGLSIIVIGRLIHRPNVEQVGRASRRSAASR